MVNLWRRRWRSILRPPDAWSRLAKIDTDEESSETVAEYQYDITSRLVLEPLTPMGMLMYRILLIALVSWVAGCESHGNGDGTIEWTGYYPDYPKGFMVAFQEPRIAIVFEGVPFSSNGEEFNIPISGSGKDGFTIQQGDEFTAKIAYANGVVDCVVNQYSFSIHKGGTEIVIDKERFQATKERPMLLIIGKDKKVRRVTGDETKAIENIAFPKKKETNK